MVWPNEFLLLVLCLGIVAVIVPWFLPRGRLMVLFGLIPALAATASWVAYEQKLHALARVGDPLIRIDLLMIVPLMVLAWVSALGSIAVKSWWGSKSEPGTGTVVGGV